jgi:hypothetical protein
MLSDLLVTLFFPRIIRNQESLMAISEDIQARLVALQASVSAETEIVASAVALIDGLKDEIVALREEVANGLGGAELIASLDAIIAANESSKQSLANAVAENVEPPDEDEDPEIEDPIDPSAPAE